MPVRGLGGIYLVIFAQYIYLILMPQFIASLLLIMCQGLGTIATVARDLLPTMHKILCLIFNTWIKMKITLMIKLKSETTFKQ